MRQCFRTASELLNAFLQPGCLQVNCEALYHRAEHTSSGFVPLGSRTPRIEEVVSSEGLHRELSCLTAWRGRAEDARQGCLLGGSSCRGAARLVAAWWWLRAALTPSATASWVSWGAVIGSSISRPTLISCDRAAPTSPAQPLLVEAAPLTPDCSRDHRLRMACSVLRRKVWGDAIMQCRRQAYTDASGGHSGGSEQWP